FGRITVAFDADSLRVGHRELYQLVPVDALNVYGFAMRYRWPGIGAPLSARTRRLETAPAGWDLVAPRVQVPLTALLRIPHARRSLVQAQDLTATLELHLLWAGETVSIAGEQVPLESEPTASLALSFTGIPVFELETLALLGRMTGILRDRPPLIS